MKNFVTPHCHQSSLDTGSTPAQFLKREQDLETGFTTVTDHGTLNAAWEVFDIAKKKGMTPIVGLEAYFRDDDCPIIKASGFPKGIRYVNPETGKWKDPEKWKELKESEKAKFLPQEGFWNYWKYAHLTMHFQDAEAYELGVKLLSLADKRAEKHGSERKPLFGWRELEELGAKNVVFGSGCLIGMVQRHLMDQNDHVMAAKYYDRLRSIVKPGNFFVEAFPHVCTHYYRDKVVVDYQDGTSETFPPWKKVKTNVDEVKAEDLAKVWQTKSNRHETIYEVMEDREWVVREGRHILNVRRDEGFVPNECRPWSPSGDLQLDCNKFMLGMAYKNKDPVLVSDDSHYAHPEEKIVQDVRLNSQGGWRFHGLYHRQSSAEAFEYFRDQLHISPAMFESWVDNSYAFGEKFKGFKFNQRLSLPTKFFRSDTLQFAKELILKHGRMRWDDPRYVARLKSELTLLTKNGKMDLLPYFFLAEEVCQFYKDQGLLTGPGRGSAAGLLFSWCLGITHVDPLKYGLSQERFLTLDRIKGGKLPDIDQDLPRTEPDILTDPETGYLRKRFGDHYAQISTDTKLSLKSSVKDVARMQLGHVPEDIEAWTKDFKEPPQGITDHDFVHGYEDADGNLQPGSIEYDDALQSYIARYPAQWAIADRCLGITRQKGRHPCAYVICNEPVSNFIPMTSVSDVPVTQYTAKSVEGVGGLKMDFLKVNSLNDIGECVKLVQEKENYSSREDVSIDGLQVPWFHIVPFQGKLYDVWDLPQEQAVFRDICEGRTETVFQFNTNTAKLGLKEFNAVRYVDDDGEAHKGLDTDEGMAAFTALDRPGPLDYYVGRDNEGEGGHNMLVEYARRACGKTSTGATALLDKLLPETFGVIVYQEQLQYIFQTVGKTEPLEADAFRTHISKKEMEKVYKDKAIFMRGAVGSLGEQEANTLWQSMETFGKYGFNKSHAVCYAAKIAYACAFLKHYFNLQWWTAVLRHADKKEVNEDFWPYCGHYMLMPDLGKSGKTYLVEGEHIRAPADLMSGIGEKAHAQLVAGYPYKDIDDFCQKIQAYRETNASYIIKEKDGKQWRHKKSGTSSLKRNIVRTLIESGAMDSLFPPNMDIFAQLRAYEIALAKATGKKKVQEVDIGRYGEVSALQRYQMKKAVLPAYSQDLVQPLIDAGVQGILFEDHSDVYGHVARHSYIIFKRLNSQGMTYETRSILADADTFRYLNTIEIGRDELVCLVGYVKSTRKWTYSGGEQGTKHAMEVILDVNGSDFKFVRWGDRNTGRLESKYNEEALKGGIVMLVVNKYRPDKPFSIEDVRVIQDPLNFKGEESSSAEQPEN